jgi:hypothetical protein
MLVFVLVVLYVLVLRLALVLKLLQMPIKEQPITKHRKPKSTKQQQTTNRFNQ